MRRPDWKWITVSLLVSGPLWFAAAPARMVSSTAQPTAIRWSIERDGSSNDASKIQLTIDSDWGAGNHSTWSNDRPISDLQGISAAQVRGATGPVRFAMVRDAGRLDCSGTAGRLTGNGACSFTVNPAFAAYLTQHGIGSPTPHEAFSLTMSGVGRDLIESMESIGYARPTAGQLASMAVHGLSGDYVRELDRSGYRLRSADDLVSFKIHGVEASYIRELAAISPKLRHLSADDIVSLRIHGVTADYVRRMAAMGPEFANLSADNLVSFSIRGARPELVAAYARFTGRPLDADDVVSMAVHGVTADFVQQMAALGYRNLSADDLVSLQIHGVTADYVRRLNASGMGHLSADGLVRLRTAGFEPRK